MMMKALPSWSVIGQLFLKARKARDALSDNSLHAYSKISPETISLPMICCRVCSWFSAMAYLAADIGAANVPSKDMRSFMLSSFCGFDDRFRRNV